MNEELIGEELDNPLEKLWEFGIIGEWYLRPSQLEVYDLIQREKNPFVEAARRFGKTTLILCHVLEKLRQNPGWIARWCEPWKDQAREIVMPEIDKIQKECRKALRFNFQVTGSVYIGPGNSRLYLRGVNEDRGESARGPTANIIIADEFGSWKDTEYTVNEVLRPQLLTTDGQFIFASSPAEDLSHPYYEHKARAINDKRFIQKTIYDNESLTPEKIAEVIKEVGGEHKPAWLREYLCQPVSDPEKLVIPEYKEELHDVDNSYARPHHFDAYLGMDLGLNDNTASLFAYVDFLKRELVVEDEIVVNGKNTKEIVEGCRAKELALWGTKACRCELNYVGLGPKICLQHGLQPYGRWGDNEAQQLYDMGSEHHYYVTATRKDDKLAALNALRLLFTEGRIKIKKRCESLRYQLKVGLWNDRRTDFRRGEKTGHLDAIDALIYLCRNLNWNHNPFPQNVGVIHATHYHNPDAEPQGRLDRELASIFEPFGGGL